MQRSTTRTKCWAVTSVPETTPEPSPSECSGHWPRASPYTPRRERPIPARIQRRLRGRHRDRKDRGRLGVPDYRVCTTYEGGKSVMEDDPYRYLPSIGDMDAYLFGGRPPRTPVGGPRRAFAATTTRWAAPTVLPATRSWAPRSPSGRQRARGRVVGNFNSWDGRRHSMRELGSSGIWGDLHPRRQGGRGLQVQSCSTRTTSGR